MVPVLFSLISLKRPPTPFPIFSFIHLPPVLPPPQAPGFSILWKGSAGEAASGASQEGTAAGHNRAMCRALGWSSGSFYCKESVWLGLPRGADSTPDLLGPAMSPWWVARRNNNLSLHPTWDQALGICSCPS